MNKRNIIKNGGKFQKSEPWEVYRILEIKHTQNGSGKFEFNIKMKWKITVHFSQHKVVQISLV